MMSFSLLSQVLNSVSWERTERLIKKYLNSRSLTENIKNKHPPTSLRPEKQILVRTDQHTFYMI